MERVTSTQQEDYWQDAKAEKRQFAINLNWIIKVKVHLPLKKTHCMKTLQNELERAVQNRSIIDGLYKAFAAGDIAAVLGAMDPNIVWNEAESNSYAVGNPYLGPEAVLNGVFAPIMEDHEYFNLKHIELHEMVNDKVLATLRYDAKTKKGNAYDAQVAHFWTLNGGKIVAFQQYVDTKKLSDAFE